MIEKLTGSVTQYTDQQILDKQCEIIDWINDKEKCKCKEYSKWVCEYCFFNKSPESTGKSEVDLSASKDICTCKDFPTFYCGIDNCIDSTHLNRKGCNHCNENKKCNCFWDKPCECTCKEDRKGCGKMTGFNRKGNNYRCGQYSKYHDSIILCEKCQGKVKHD